MKKYTLYIGLNDKDSKHQEITTLDAYKIASNVFCQYTGGATISEAHGVYTHDDGTIITETSLRCEIYGADMSAIIQAVAELKTALNQESILIETVKTTSNFI